MAANDTQVGGTHYKDMGDYQPWDVLKHWLTPEEYRGYQKGVAIAYLARELAKNGDQDIKKAIHHLQKLMEVIDETRVSEVMEGTAPGVAQAADGSWIEWGGGSQPVADDAVVEVRLRGIWETGRDTADCWNWEHSATSPDADIIAYRVA